MTRQCVQLWDCRPLQNRNRRELNAEHDCIIEKLYEPVRRSVQKRFGDGGFDIGCGDVKSRSIICPMEVKQYEDGSVWFKLDATIAVLAVEPDGKAHVKKA